ncbi:hypothetical protein BZG29_19790 [Janthinobacterium sp. LM6]|nr:hypothetical protein BZG29_19790 [Janthinobacterium sp. LM6]
MHISRINRGVEPFQAAGDKAHRKQRLPARFEESTAPAWNRTELQQFTPNIGHHAFRRCLQFPFIAPLKHRIGQYGLDLLQNDVLLSG